MNGETLRLKDVLNPPCRSSAKLPTYLIDPDRGPPEPPRFATKFLDEFSGRQTNLRSFFRKQEPFKEKGRPFSSKKPSGENLSTANDQDGQSSTSPEKSDGAFDIALTAFRSIPTTSPSLRSPVSKSASSSNKDRSKAKAGQTELSAYFKSGKKNRVPSNPLDDVADEDIAEIAQAIADAEDERASKRAKTNAEAGTVWSSLFARKLPPLCTVHQTPCKDFSTPEVIPRMGLTLVVKIPGPNKGKRFWLCSL